MTLCTLLAYLFGSRDAIERIVADPWAVWVGLALTLSTGLARSYATHDLRKQPWRLILPPVVALLLTGLLYSASAIKAGAVPGSAGFRSVAALVLLTAPLAWLYAIPYERIVPPYSAVALRLLTLAVVAVWRVVLVSVAVAVLLACELMTAGSLVLSIATGAMVLGIVVPWWRGRKHRETVTPMLLGAMTGMPAPNLVRNPARKLVVNVSVAVAIAGTIGLPFLLSRASDGAADARAWHDRIAGSGGDAPSLGLWLLAVGAVAVFALLLPWGQRRPRLRTVLTEAFEAGRIADAIRLLSAHQPSDLMPDWQPPPESDYRNPPRLLDVIEAVHVVRATGWVRDLYRARFRAYLAEPLWYWYYDADLERISTLLSEMPEGKELARIALEAGVDFQARMEKNGGHLTKRGAGNEDRDPLWEVHLDPEPEITLRREEIIAGLRRIAEGEGETQNGR